jgi:TrmH family RNA methyltransferase
MLSKKEAKDIQSLAHKKGRAETGWFVAEGPKIVGELLQAMPDSLVALYATDEWAAPDSWLSVPVQRVKEQELQRLSSLQTSNGVLALFRQRKMPPLRKEVFSLYLDTIQDPGNFGTLIRIADWFGVEQVICSTGCADLYNPKVVQATMGSLARVTVVVDEDGSFLSGSGPIYAAVLGGTSLYDLPPATTGILLIGNESKGIRTEWIGRADHRITIPRRGGAESLNAAVATGIILSHLVR